MVMLCGVSEDGDLLDGKGEELTSISDIVEDITGIATLNKKPKLIAIQGFPGIMFFSN